MIVIFAVKIKGTFFSFSGTVTLNIKADISSTPGWNVNNGIAFFKKLFVSVVYRNL